MAIASRPAPLSGFSAEAACGLALGHRHVHKTIIYMYVLARDGAIQSPLDAMIKDQRPVSHRHSQRNSFRPDLLSYQFPGLRHNPIRRETELFLQCRKRG